MKTHKQAALFAVLFTFSMALVSMLFPKLETGIFEMYDKQSSYEVAVENSELVTPVVTLQAGLSPAALSRDTSISIVDIPAFPTGDGVTWIDWVQYFLLWGKAIIGNLLAVLLALTPIIRMIPSQKDNDPFRVVASWLDWIGDKLPLLGIFFVNKRSGGGTHTAYPDANKKPKIGASVPQKK
jgi:hypothetical protein